MQNTKYEFNIAYTADTCVVKQRAAKINAWISIEIFYSALIEANASCKSFSCAPCINFSRALLEAQCRLQHNSLFYSNAHCAYRILSFAIENTLHLKIRTGADPHSVRTLYGKFHVFSMQFIACGKFPDSYKNTINLVALTYENVQTSVTTAIKLALR